MPWDLDPQAGQRKRARENAQMACVVAALCAVPLLWGLAKGGEPPYDKGGATAPTYAALLGLFGAIASIVLAVRFQRQSLTPEEKAEGQRRAAAFAQAERERQEAVANVRQLAQRRAAEALLTLRSCRYVGGLPGKPLADHVAVHLGPEVLTVSDLQQVRFELPWREVLQLSVESATELQRRTTAVRLVAVGLLSFAMTPPKSAWLIVSTSGGEALFEVRGLVPQELRAALGLAGLQVGRRPDAGAPSRSAADRIRDLAELRSDGLVDEEEYARRRLQLLDEL